MANTWTILLPSYYSLAFPTSKTPQILMTRRILSLFIITTLLTFVRATPESNIIYERQSSQFCNGGIGLPNGDLYCAPKANETFPASTIKFAWNTEDGEIKTKGQVDVYLFRNEDFALVYTNLAVDNNLQVLAVKVNSSWFPSAPGPQPKNVEFFFKVMASGASLLLAPQGPVFQITEPAAEPTIAAPVPIITTSTETISPSATTVVSSDEKSTTFTPPLIAIVCVACITACVAIIALTMAAKSRKARSGKSMSTLSTSSTTPMVMDSKYKDSRDLESPVDVSSISSGTTLSKKESQPNIAQRISLSSPSRSSLTGIPSVTFSSVSSAGALSVSEAAFLSDAFRHGLRKPEWGADVDDEEEDEGEELTEEEKRLRREAKELMKKELAEEGTGLQSVSRKQARIEIMDAKDLLAEGEFEGDNKERDNTERDNTESDNKESDSTESGNKESEES